jgi:hypothetical protein
MKAIAFCLSGDSKSPVLHRSNGAVRLIQAFGGVLVAMKLILARFLAEWK